MKKILASVFLIFFTFNLFSQDTISLVSLGSAWKYKKGTENPPSGWNLENFNDAAWVSGNAPFWYGKGSGGTLLSDMLNTYTTIYFRKTFQITIPDSMLSSTHFQFTYDDGFRIFVNGVAILEKNAGETDTAFSTTPTVINPITESASLPASEANIKFGTNTIAVVGYNYNLTSSDFYFDMKMSLVPKAGAMPKAPEVSFDKAGGYYNTAFNVVLSSLNVGDTILYTLDCSDPVTSSTVKKGKSPLTVNINPVSTNGRPLTPAVIVRAAVAKTGYASRNSETRTYIFANKVKTQTYPGAPWPLPNDDKNIGQLLQYNVDSALVAVNYSTTLEPALKSIPTVSIVTENDNLFNTMTGIYVNALSHGEDWERPASLELIETNNNMEFSNNIGLRIRGGWSRHNEFAKHAFRIFYRGDYGKKKLEYPIFGKEGTDEFDKFDIKCAQNYAWSREWGSPYMTYAQDEFCRDMQGKMGDPYTKSRYCQVFLNGMYWGLYEFQERAEANFAASYKGGDKDNYDVIKVASGEGHLEATDGDMIMYQKLFDMTKLGFTSNTNYYKVQGLNAQGQIDTSLNALLDVDNMIDYMLDIFYSGNFDSPISAYMGNTGVNNYYAIKNKKHKRQGFFFVVHDAEHTFSWNKAEHEIGDVNVNRVKLDELEGSTLDMNNFTTYQMHYKLRTNAEYKIKFADRAYDEFYNGGLFTSSVVTANFRARASQIDQAIIGESARWGHGWLIRQDWVNAVNNTVSEFINLRTPIVIQQLKDAGLLTDFVPATIAVNSTVLSAGTYTLANAVTVKLTNPNTTGTIYYTLDGSDPRLTGGTINTTAQTLTSGSTFSVAYPLKLKIRVKDGTTWSPIREVLFTNKLNRENIRITEIQYNPKDLNAASSKDMEFIELKNIGDKGVDIGGCKLDSAAKFIFPQGTIINPGGFVVVASDKNDFEYVYRLSPTGVFTGNLSNEGERIKLFDENNNTLLDVTYDVNGSWPTKPNGSGFSLVARLSQPAKEEANPGYWKSSQNIYGSPFSDDDTYTSIKNPTLFCEVYPNPVSEELYINTSDRNPVKLQIHDLSGRTIWNAEFENTSGTVSVNFKSLGIKEGIYLVGITSGQNKVQKKIVYQE